MMIYKVFQIHDSLQIALDLNSSKQLCDVKTDDQDEICSTSSSGIFSDDTEDTESDIYTIRRVSKQVFLNHQKLIVGNCSGQKRTYTIIKPLPPIPPPKPARLYLPPVRSTSSVV